MEELNLTNFPVIVIDGVDYSGKTTLTSCLIEHGFTRIKSPSNDKEGKYVIKRAFVDFASKDETYSLFRKNNFHLSANMLSQTDSPIVLDRFFFIDLCLSFCFSKKRFEI